MKNKNPIEANITNDFPLSLSFNKFPACVHSNVNQKFEYIGAFLPKHHVYLPNSQYMHEDRLYPFQLHDGIEILYITEGKGILYTPDQQLKLECGDICFINPYELHGFSCYSNTSCDRLSIVFFQKPILNDVYSLPEDAAALAEGSLHLQRLIHHTDPIQPHIASYLWEIKDICQRRACCHVLELHSVLLRLIASLLENHRTVSGVFDSTAIPDFVYGIITYINRNLYSEITSHEAAQYVGYTNNYFCRIFKQYFGTTFSEYVLTARISAAKSILTKEPDIPISRLAESVGFRNVSYFISAFRKATGMTPSVYARGVSRNIDSTL